MARGVLQIHGTLEVSQFWPEGRSDADTTSIELNVDEHSFFFQPAGAAEPLETSAFEGAEVRVKGQGPKQVIRTLKTTGQRKITVRLQGVDAPELHLRVTPAVRTAAMSAAEKDAWEKVKGEYRQLQAEAATVALADVLGGAGASLAARFETMIDEPNDAVDAYGRFVGDLMVPRGTGELNVNRWLISQGWGTVSFYSSMLPHEIEELRTLSRAAKKRNARRFYDPAARFDFGHRYRSRPKDVDSTDFFDPEEDQGPYVMPKVFRRLAQYSTNKRAGFVSGTFQKYLEERSEGCFDTEDFLANGPYSATVHRFHEMLESGILAVAPEDLVFQESKARLVDENGDPPEWF